MAVYTPLTDDDIGACLAQYDIGTLEAWHGIADGVENSNFRLTTTTGNYILTLFEKRVSEEELPYCLGLMEWLEARGIPCPRTIHTRQGTLLTRVKNKPAAIVSFLMGQGAVETLMVPPYIGRFGTLIAQMHQESQGFPAQRPNHLNLAGWKALAATIGAQAEDIAPGLSAVIGQELTYLERNWPQDLPSGPIHADLFPDNVFFDRGYISGVIDFYFACDDAFAYDLAICINAWCFNAAQQFEENRLNSLFEAYQKQRPLTPAEKNAFPLLLRGAALRFLLTRAHDWIFHPHGALVTPKNPLEYLAKLRFFQTKDIRL